MQRRRRYAVDTGFLHKTAINKAAITMRCTRSRACECFEMKDPPFGLSDRWRYHAERFTLKISLLNLTAVFVFCAWLMGISQIEVWSRVAWVVGTACFTVVASMLIALCSPEGDGRLDVEKNLPLVIFFSFSKFVIAFAALLIPMLIISELLGYRRFTNWWCY